MNEFEDVLQYFNDRIRGFLINIPDSVKFQITEIRVKVGQPITIITTTSSYYLLEHGLSKTPYHCAVVSRAEFNDCIKIMCNYSFCTYESEINNGYITLKNGHRVGICGSFSNGGVILSCDDITSFNMRISRYIKSFGDEIVDQFISDSNHLLISGKPSSGKTTLIRDIAASLSNRMIKVLVVDERNEIVSASVDRDGRSLGPFCDVISNCCKSKSAEIAIRTMSPDVIIFDEIGFNDCETMQKVANAGVIIIATFHSFSDGGNSFILNKMLEYGFCPTILHLNKIGQMPTFDYKYANV